MCMPRNPYNRKVDFVFYSRLLVLLSILGNSKRYRQLATLSTGVWLYFRATQRLHFIRHMIAVQFFYRHAKRSSFVEGYRLRIRNHWTLFCIHAEWSSCVLFTIQDTLFDWYSIKFHIEKCAQLKCLFL